MFGLTERVKDLREKAMNWRNYKIEYAGQKWYNNLKALADTNPYMPVMQRNATVLARTILGCAPYIREGELIVGYNFSEQEGLELSMRPPREEAMPGVKAYLDQGTLTDEQKQFIFDTLNRINEITPRHVSHVVGAPPEAIAADRAGVIHGYSTPMNHTIISFERVISMGFGGLKKYIKGLIADLDPKDGKSLEKRLVLDSALEVADAAASIGRIYSDHARKLLETCTDAAQKKDLNRLIKVLDRVPEHPARTFHEAVQALWFTHVINCWEDGINANSLGRMDYVLYPYYKHDIENGIITKEEAFELICCLWIKLYREYDVQQSSIGGLNSDGSDSTNDLSYMMLDATEELDFVRCLSVRVHKNTPKELLRRSLQVVAKGKGMPFYFNDDAIVPALVRYGIPIEDARVYAPLGCIEITIPGKTNPHAVSNRVNILKCFELAMNDGVNMLNGDQLGPKTGKLEDMKTFEDLVKAYKKQVEYFVGLANMQCNRYELMYSHLYPLPFKSLLTEGCLEEGRDFNNGGAVYNYHQSMPMGIPNVADSLEAVKRAVFDEHKYTLTEVFEMLKENWPDEAIRNEFVNRFPKYGNDIDEVDELAAMVMKHYCDYLKGFKGVFKGGFTAQPFTFLWYAQGRDVAATPDGRKSRQDLAYSISPMSGRDDHGFSAVLNSLAKLPNKLAAGATSAIIELDPQLFNQSSLDWMTAALATAIKKGVGQLQFNVVSVETLKEAQLEPEKHKNLAVRVTGFSQKFCLLDKGVQDHIISRTKHKVG